MVFAFFFLLFCWENLSFCLSTQQLVRDRLTLLVLVLFCCLTFNFIFFSWSSYSPPLTAAFLCSPSLFFHNHHHLSSLLLSPTLTFTHLHTRHSHNHLWLCCSLHLTLFSLNPNPPSLALTTPDIHPQDVRHCRVATKEVMLVLGLLASCFPSGILAALFSMFCVQWCVWVLQV